MKELSNNDLHFIYGKNMTLEIRRKLLFAEQCKRVTIHEWKNFVDYDIIPLIRNSISLIGERRSKRR